MSKPFPQIDISGRGYFGIPSPPSESRFPDNPRENPSLAWLIAIQEAKRGNFDPVSQIFKVYDPAGDYIINYQCATFVSDAGPASIFDPMVQELRDPGDPGDYEVAIDFSYALSSRGRLADAPVLLQAYERHESVEDAEIIPVYILSMLQGDSDDLSTPDFMPSLEDYRNAVMQRYNDLVESLGGSNVPVLRGKRFGVIRLAERILSDLNQPYFNPDLRRKFEASTGIDCTAFYSKSGKIQPLAAAAVVEGFLESPEAQKYEDGTRYFFGHRIPD